MSSRPFGHIRIPLQRVHIELTNVCNFNCVFCPKSEMTRPNGYMDGELAIRLIDELKDQGICDKVTFHVMGEPTLHPRFFDILDHAAKRDLQVGLTTNGAYLNTPVGRRLLDYPLYQLDVSLQTPDEASYHLREAPRKLTYQNYIDGILTFFHEYKVVRKRDQTMFKFRFLNTRLQSSEMREKKGDIVVIHSTAQLRQQFLDWVNRLYDLLEVTPEFRAQAMARINGLSAYKWNVVEIFPNVCFETYLLKNWTDNANRQVRDAWAGYCYGMRDHFAVLWNGEVVLCCQDFNGKTSVGNVRERTLASVLADEPLGGIMRGFNRLQVVHPYCKKCLGAAGTGTWLVKPVVDLMLLKVLKPFFYQNLQVWK